MSEAFERKRFEGDAGTAKLVTDVLFNRGFKRYRVSLVSEQGESRVETIWAQSRKQLSRALNHRGFLLVQIEERPIGWFEAQLRGNGKRWTKTFTMNTDAWGKPSAMHLETAQFEGVELAGDWILWPEDIEQTQGREEKAG